MDTARNRSGVISDEVIQALAVLAAIAGVFGLPYLIGEILDYAELVQSKHHAAASVFVAITSSLLLLVVLDKAQRRFSIQGLTPQGQWGYVAIALFALLYSVYGAYSFNI